MILGTDTKIITPKRAKMAKSSISVNPFFIIITYFLFYTIFLILTRLFVIYGDFFICFDIIYFVKRKNSVSNLITYSGISYFIMRANIFVYMCFLYSLNS